MPARISFPDVPHGLMSAMMAVEDYINGTGLGTRLLELMRLRVSQLNGCAYCIDMHYKEAIAAGEQDLRLYSLSVWHTTSFYDEKENAVLAWAEAVTLLTEDKITNELFEKMRRIFTQEQLANLTLAVVQINSWNRLAKSFGFEPGHYKTNKR